MDTGKSELKILTDTILAVLEHHTQAIESGLKDADLLHSSVIKKLLEKIEDFKLAPPPLKSLGITASAQEVEVLHGVPKDIGLPPTPEAAIEQPVEGPKERNPMEYANLPKEDVTPENIDKFADLMGDDSIPEPKIEGLKND